MQKTELRAKPSFPGRCEKTWGRSTMLEDCPKAGRTALEMVDLHTTLFYCMSSHQGWMPSRPFGPSREAWSLLVAPCALHLSLGGTGAFVGVCRIMNCVL